MNGQVHSGLADHLEAVRMEVEAALRTALSRAEGEAKERGVFVPARLWEAMAYTVLGGGKRLRPAVVRLVAEEFGADPARAEPAGVALELLHTYSLVHDDLPSMDDDVLRRGRPTCHVVYGEAMGVLVGDALQTLAFEVLASRGEPAGALVAVLARAAGAAGMVGGQVLDLYPATRPEGLAGVRAVHQAKTAALFAAAAEMGALLSGQSPRTARALSEYGEALGLCFQAVDDVLDVTGDASTLGKTPGKDAALDRMTLVAHLGLEGARGEARRRAEDAEAALVRAGVDPRGRLGELVRLVLARRT